MVNEIDAGQKFFEQWKQRMYKSIAKQEDWIYEDSLPAAMSQADYDNWFEKSRVIDGVRMGPPLYHVVIRDGTFDNVLWPKIPSEPQAEIDLGHTVDCAVPYVLPVLGLVLGGAVLALALGYWAIQKLRLW